jgi:hypothetical protein
VSRSIFSVVLVVVAVGPFGAGGCSSSSSSSTPVATGKLTVRVMTDFACADVKGATIAVGSAVEIASKAPELSITTCDAASGILGEVVIPAAKLGADPSAIQVVLGARKTPEECAASGFSGPCVVARRTFAPPQGDAIVVVTMRSTCVGVTCSATQTCVAGACVVAQVDLSTCGDRGCDETQLAPK